jgi:hypothetical protein
MSHQPDDCPKPPGQCPYEQDDIAVRLARIEVLLGTMEGSQRDFRDRIVRVLDEQYMAGGRHSDDIEWLKAAVKNLLMLMEGQMGRPGMIVAEARMQQDIEEFKKWKSRQTSFVTGVVAAASFFSGIVAFLATAIYHLVTKR